ncbi:MAG TPA: glycosyltransferase, partial [Burkholderiaceae bacterium]|nr:glycosyltransferase [Burkholderiaceae bacterium]
MSAHTLLIMAGGTGGHIMPGLAVAHEMKSRGWQVLWMGDPGRMEGRLVPPAGIELLPLRFAGLRGKGLLALLKLPYTLLAACWQARRALRRARPDVVLGMGGYVAFPGGLMAAAQGTPVVIHEQNAVAGTANRWLARIARKVLVGFPGALPGAVMVGNPVRATLAQLPPASERYAG